MISAAGQDLSDFYEDASINAVITTYPAFSGGKFLMNVMGLSKHAALMSRTAVAHLTKSPEDYDFRLDAVLHTLPPRDQMRNWQDYEFGDHQFYGDAFLSWLQGNQCELDPFVQELCCSGLKFCMSDHSLEPLQLLTVWPKAKVVLFTNSRHFQHTALRKKSFTWPEEPEHFYGNYCEEKFSQLRGEDWPDWHIFEKYQYDIDKVAKHVTIDTDVQDEIRQYYTWYGRTDNVFCFDVDANYFSKSKFLTTTKQIYDWMGFDDFDPVLIDRYYSQYISLHED